MKQWSALRTSGKLKLHLNTKADQWLQRAEEMLAQMKMRGCEVGEEETRSK